jgi:hypothetical protein
MRVLILFSEVLVTRRIGIAWLVAALATVGCGGQTPSGQQGQQSQGAEALKQGAQGMEQMAKGFQQMAQGAAKPVDFEQLKAVLPEVSGWTRTDVRGEQVNMPIAISRAEARYQKDNGNIELEITDTALSQLLLAPLSMFLASGYEERSDDGHKRAVKVGGQPGMEEWNARSKRGEVTAVVGNRFIVKATGRDVADLAAVRQVVELVGFNRLAALK